MEDVYDTKNGLRLNSDGDWCDFAASKEYGFFHFGDAAVTKAAIRICEEAGIPIYRLRKSGKHFTTTRGYFLPASIAKKAQRGC